LKADFPEFFENDFAKLRVVDEEAMKSKTGKAKWRKWLKQWENTMSACAPAALMGEFGAPRQTSTTLARS
jgi:hypothetical protein